MLGDIREALRNTVFRIVMGKAPSRAKLYEIWRRSARRRALRGPEAAAAAAISITKTE